MRSFKPLWLFAAVVFTTPNLVAGAQVSNAVSDKVEPAAPAVTSAIEPEAMAALNKMGAYLRGLTDFQVKATTTKENVLDDGEKVQTAAVADILARKPNRLRAELTGDDQHRLYVYDGKQFSVFAARLGFYATAPAPATIGQLVDLLEDKYGINMPLADLFFWGTDAAQTAAITGARSLGSTTVEGTTVEHFAFRQNGLDWQIWIQEGENPLPRKLVLTTTDDEARPQYSAVINWNLAPSYNDAAFVFDPPKTAKKILLADVNVPLGTKVPLGSRFPADTTVKK